MSLTVEDGTLVTGADSYVSLANADIYWSANGEPAAWTALDDAGKEAKLRSAARYLNDGQRLPFTGAQRAWDQPLAWPRTGATNYGMTVPSDVIPPAVIEAQLWLTVNGQAAGVGGTVSSPALTGNVKREQLGPLEKEYFSPKEMQTSVEVVVVSEAPADLVGMLYGLLDKALLEGLTSTVRLPPLLGATMVDPCSLDDVTRFLHLPPRWP
jgi:hypothetical protein